MHVILFISSPQEKMKMAYLTPYENLRGFASSRPPLVVFMVCMGLFAIVLLSLAYYVKWNEIKNPDISQVRCHQTVYMYVIFCSSGEIVNTRTVC